MSGARYDDWKTDAPQYGVTAAQEAEEAEDYENRKQALRDAIGGALIDERGELRLADVREIVMAELNLLAPLASEPKGI